MGQLVLRLENISKAFPGVQALQKASLNVYAGEVMALLGENGAGKSTMMKVLTGVYQKDEGTITYLGREIAFQNARQAQEGGIAIIHQELNLVPQMRVYENVFLGRELKNGLVTDRRKMIEVTRELLSRVRVAIDPMWKVAGLSIAQQQMVEIAKALLLDARVIVMDEPTDALPEEEVDNLFHVINQLKAQGKAVVYISHRLEEVFRICDRATVLRDGQFMGEVPVSELTMDRLINMLVGRPLSQQFPYEPPVEKGLALRVQNLSNRYLRGVSFELRRGEVLGVTGLVGAGRTELAKTLYGLYPADSGTMELLGTPYSPRNPSEAIARGLYYMTEDRKRNGLVMPMDVRANITLSSLNKLKNRGVLNLRKEKDAVKHIAGYCVCNDVSERAFQLERVSDALVDLRVLQNLDLAGALAHEHGDRHAPGALARDHPVRLGIDHAVDAVAARGRHPLRHRDRVHRAGAQGVARLRLAAVGDILVHRDEPLRRIAEDHRRL